MNILAIDTGTKMGWCALHNDQEHYGLLDYSLKARRKSDDEDAQRGGKEILQFNRDLRRILSAFEINVVAYERNHMVSSSLYNHWKFGEWQGAIKSQIAVENELREADGRPLIEGPYAWTTGQWRQGFFGKYPKVPDHLNEKERYSYHKQKAISSVQEAGYTDVEDDNVAEAILLMIAVRKSVDKEFSALMGTPVQEELL